MPLDKIKELVSAAGLLKTKLGGMEAVSGLMGGLFDRK